MVADVADEVWVLRCVAVELTRVAVDVGVGSGGATACAYVLAGADDVREVELAENLLVFAAACAVKISAGCG